MLRIFVGLMNYDTYKNPQDFSLVNLLVSGILLQNSKKN